MREIFESFGLVPARPRQLKAEVQQAVPGRLIDLGGYGRTRAIATPHKVKRGYKTLITLSQSPIPARAINLIVDRICALEEKIAPHDGMIKAGRIKRSEDYSKEIDTVRRVLDNPNHQDEDWGTFKQQILADMLRFDFGAFEYVEKPTPPVGPNDLLMLAPVPGWSIEAIATWNGEPNAPRWLQNAGGLKKKVPLLNKQIEAIISRKRTESPYGVSPLEVAMGLMDAMLKLSSYQASVASEAYPAFMFSLGTGAGEELVKQYRLYWNNEMMGQGRPGIIGGFEDPKSIQLKATGDEGLYLKYYELLVRALAFTFGLKPQDFGIQERDNRATSQVAQSASIDEAIRPYAMKLVSRFNARLIPRIAAVANMPRILDLQYSYPNIDPDNAKEQADILISYLEHDVFTFGQIQERLGEEPGDNADMYYSQFVAQSKAEFGPAPTNFGDDPDAADDPDADPADADDADDSMAAGLLRRLFAALKKKTRRNR